MLKHINFNRKIGQRTLDDDTLSNFIQNFEKIPLRNENFEIPDLLGVAAKTDCRLYVKSKLPSMYYSREAVDAVGDGLN